MTNNQDTTKTKIDWSTPYDEWLIPILNRARHCGPIEFRSLPSQIQLRMEEVQKDRDQQIALAAQNAIFIDITTGHKIGQMIKKPQHNVKCSFRQMGLMCDCEILQVAHYAVDQAKARVKQAQEKSDHE